MAFTVAHMAAALPFFKRNRPNHSYRWVNFEAMMIGSVMPDLPYFIGNILPNLGSVQHAWEVSHHWVGLVSYCLPWGLLIYFLWVLWFKPAFFELMTPFMSTVIYSTEKQSSTDKKTGLRKTSIGSKLTHWISWVLIPLSIGIVFGAITHILWDATTHIDGFISTRVGFLQQSIPVYPIGEMKVARFLQFFTSIIGLLALLGFVISLFLQGRCNYNQINERSSIKAKSVHLFTKKQSLITIASLGILIALIGIVESVRFYSLLPSDIYGFMVGVLIHSMRKIALALFVYTLFYHLIRGKHRISMKGY